MTPTRPATMIGTYSPEKSMVHDPTDSKPSEKIHNVVGRVLQSGGMILLLLVNETQKD